MHPVLIVETKGCPYCILPGHHPARARTPAVSTDIRRLFRAVRNDVWRTRSREVTHAGN